MKAKPSLSLITLLIGALALFLSTVGHAVTPSLGVLKITEGGTFVGGTPLTTRSSGGMGTNIFGPTFDPATTAQYVPTPTMVLVQPHGASDIRLTTQSSATWNQETPNQLRLFLFSYASAATGGLGVYPSHGNVESQCDSEWEFEISEPTTVTVELVLLRQGLPGYTIPFYYQGAENPTFEPVAEFIKLGAAGNQTLLSLTLEDRHRAGVEELGSGLPSDPGVVGVWPAVVDYYSLQLRRTATVGLAPGRYRMHTKSQLDSGTFPGVIGGAGVGFGCRVDANVTFDVTPPVSQRRHWVGHSSGQIPPTEASKWLENEVPGPEHIAVFDQARTSASYLSLGLAQAATWRGLIAEGLDMNLDLGGRRLDFGLNGSATEGFNLAVGDQGALPSALTLKNGIVRAPAAFRVGHDGFISNGDGSTTAKLHVGAGADVETGSALNVRGVNGPSTVTVSDGGKLRTHAVDLNRNPTGSSEIYDHDAGLVVSGENSRLTTSWFSSWLEANVVIENNAVLEIVPDSSGISLLNTSGGQWTLRGSSVKINGPDTLIYFGVISDTDIEMEDTLFTAVGNTVNFSGGSLYIHGAISALLCENFWANGTSIRMGASPDLIVETVYAENEMRLRGVTLRCDPHTTGEVQLGGRNVLLGYYEGGEGQGSSIALDNGYLFATNELKIEYSSLLLNNSEARASYTFGNYIPTVTLTGSVVELRSTTRRAKLAMVNGTMDADSSIQGNGDLIGNLVNRGGMISPGLSPGHLKIEGNYTQEAGVIRLEIAGPTPVTEHDVLEITGDFNFQGGYIELIFLDGHAPAPGQTYEVLKTAAGSLPPNIPVVVRGLEPGWQHEVLRDTATGSFTIRSQNAGQSAGSVPTTGITTDGFPRNPKSLWWHNEFTAHPTNGWLYGTCGRGGIFNNGMIYRVNAQGDYETLVHFTSNGSHSKGKEPAGRLTFGSDGNLYGATALGGANNKGTVFKMTPDGTLTTLVSFTGSSGAVLGQEPTGGVIEGADGNFYGTTKSGGTGNFGTVFKITPAGVFTTLVSFTDLSGPSLGSFPNGTLAQDADGNLYGTTVWGGTGGKGTVFKVTPAGVLTNLVNFTGTSGANLGEQPHGGLTLAANGSFYGMTSFGGALNHGTVFKMTTGGVLTTLAEFTNNSSPLRGSKPFGDLTLGLDGNLYGLTSEGGENSKGTIFKVTPDGVLTTLVNFSGNGSSHKGAFPKGTLGLGLDGSFYGTTQNGGAQDQGTIFKVTPAGVLTTLRESTTFTGGVTDAGGYLQGGVVSGPDGSLYGTTFSGGANDKGTVFKLDRFGRHSTLVHFTGNSGSARGANPTGTLVMAGDGNFYGTTQNGGSSGFGTIYRMNPAGGFTTVVDFTDSGTTRGKHPYGRLTVGPGGALYGMTNEGGTQNVGTLFKLPLTGGLISMIHFNNFTDASGSGYWPLGHLTLAPDGNLYGMTNSGGANDHGTLFRLTPAGDYTVLVNFNLNGPTDGVRGGWPWGSLALGPDGTLYGMTSSGGLGNGTIFKMTTAGAFTHLQDFTGTSGATPGANALGAMVAAPDGFLYGTTNSGGAFNMGTLFKMTPGGAVTTVTHFKGAGMGLESGGSPYLDELTLSTDGQVYGTTNVGGRQGGGMVYRIEMHAAEIEVRGNNTILANNDSTPDDGDHTHFGLAGVTGGSITRTYTIVNNGTQPLTLGAVNITGASASNFTVSNAPSATVGAGGSTTLDITFSPSAPGMRVAQVSIATNDSDETPFAFAISGTGNTAPAFSGMTLYLVQGAAVAISEAEIRGRASDADGQVLTISSVAGSSTQGAGISRGGGFISYSPPANFVGTDSFVVTLGDGFTAASGTITIQVSADPAFGPNQSTLISALPGGVIRLGFAGIPNRRYGVQRSVDLINWTQIATPVAASDGEVVFEDPLPPPDRAFYRIIFPTEP